MRRCMGVRASFAVGFSLLLVPAAGAQQAYTIRYRVAPGTQMTYTVSLTGSGQLNFEQQSQTLALEASFRVAERVLSTLPDESRVVETEITAADVKVNGSPLAMPLTGFKVQTIRDPLGRVTSAQSPELAGAGNLWGLDMNTLVPNLGKLLAWPQQPVAVGQAWDSSTTLPLPSGQTATISATSALRAVQESQGQAIGYVDSQLSLPVDLMTPFGYRVTGAINTNLRSAVQLADGLLLEVPQMRMAVGVQFLGGTDGKTPVGSLVIPDMQATVTGAH